MENWKESERERDNKRRNNQHQQSEIRSIEELNEISLRIRKINKLMDCVEAIYGVWDETC